VGEFNYGGQAVMEGVMMRGAKSMAVAVRAPSGQIVVHSEPLNRAIYGSWLSKVPFLRGVTLLWDTLILGTRTLMFSADVASQAETMGRQSDSVASQAIAARSRTGAGEPPEGAARELDPGLRSSDSSGKLGVSGNPEASGTSGSLMADPVAWGTIIVSIGLAVGLFFLLPALLAKWLDPLISSSLLSNLVESLIRLSFVLAYVWGVGFLPDVRRVFAYHGAEHKTVHAYEAGESLTVETIQAHTTAHARCGTSFILVVVFISVLIFSLLGRPPLLLRLASRVLLLPVIAGISYEWLKFSARHENSWWIKVLLLPGLAMQKLTTREPDDQMVEVAVVALQRVLQEDGLLAKGVSA
jgi:uncharacterized protein YqhQ